VAACAAARSWLEVNPLLDWAWSACLVRARVIRPVFFQAACQAEAAHQVHGPEEVLLVVVRQAAVQVAAQSDCQVSEAVPPEVQLAQRIALDALSVPS
jgi:hypothetical protein